MYEFFFVVCALNLCVSEWVSGSFLFSSLLLRPLRCVFIHKYGEHAIGEKVEKQWQQLIWERAREEKNMNKLESSATTMKHIHFPLYVFFHLYLLQKCSLNIIFLCICCLIFFFSLSKLRGNAEYGSAKKKKKIAIFDRRKKFISHSPHMRYISTTIFFLTIYPKCISLW